MEMMIGISLIGDIDSPPCSFGRSKLVIKPDSHCSGPLNAGFYTYQRASASNTNCNLPLFPSEVPVDGLHRTWESITSFERSFRRKRSPPRNWEHFVQGD